MFVCVKQFYIFRAPTCIQRGWSWRGQCRAPTEPPSSAGSARPSPSSWTRCSAETCSVWKFRKYCNYLGNFVVWIKILIREFQKCHINRPILCSTTDLIPNPSSSFSMIFLCCSGFRTSSTMKIRLQVRATAITWNEVKYCVQFVKFTLNISYSLGRQVEEEVL